MTAHLRNNARQITLIVLAIAFAYSYVLQASQPAAACAAAGAHNSKKISPARIACLEEKISEQFKTRKEKTALINAQLEASSLHETELKKAVLRAKEMIQSAVKQGHVHPDNLHVRPADAEGKGLRLLGQLIFLGGDSQLTFIQFLLEHGATVSNSENYPDLPIAKSAPMAKLLMHHGASLQKDGAQALFETARSSEGSSALVQLYIDLGIDPNIQLPGYYYPTPLAACIEEAESNFHENYSHDRAGYEKFKKDKENRYRKIEILLQEDARLNGPGYNIPCWIKIHIERLKDLNLVADVEMFEEMKARIKKALNRKIKYLQTGLPKDLALCKDATGNCLPRELSALITLYYCQELPNYEQLEQIEHA